LATFDTNVKTGVMELPHNGEMLTTVVSTVYQHVTDERLDKWICHTEYALCISSATLRATIKFVVARAL